jgi:hypothetical protein
VKATGWIECRAEKGSRGKGKGKMEKEMGIEKGKGMGMGKGKISPPQQRGVDARLN